MFLTSPERTLEISFRVNNGENSYMLYASTDNLKCFECGNLGHKRFSCPNKKVDNEQRLPVDSTESEPSKNNDSTDAVEITTTPQMPVTEKKRPSERVIGHNEVSESDDDAEDEQAGCSYAVVRLLSEVEDVVSESVTDAQAVEEGSVDELDGVSQCTDDNMNEQWFEGEEMSKVMKEDLYTVAQISGFLDETKGKKVEVSDFFPDLDKFIASVMWARRHSSYEELSQQKHFRLKKHITAIRQKSETKVKR